MSAHIHHLLDEYVAVHLATNYTDFTQLQVYQVLTGGWLPISAKDTHSLLPPSEPLDNFVQENCRIEPPNTWERLTTVKGAHELISCTIGAVPFERTSFHDTFCSFSPRFDCDTDSPVLTVRSVRLTPRFGHSGVPQFVPVHLGGILRLCGVELEKEGDFGCDNVGGTTEDVVHPRLTVDNHMLKQIVSLYPFSAALRSEAKQSLSSVFLCRTASPTLLSSSPQTPPLFSRGHATLGKPVQDLTTMTNLPSIIPLAMSDDNEGTPEYDVITDLWSMPTTSSQPASPLDDCQGEQGEIFAPSSDSREPIGDLLAAKMDMVCMRRSSGFGGSHNILNVPGQHQRLHEYIGSIIDFTSASNIIATSSLPSPTDNVITSLTSAHQVCASHQPNDIRRHSDDTADNPYCLLSGDLSKEGIDVDLFDWPEETGLMDVPPLPAPNVHTRHIALSNDLGSLLAHRDFSFFCVVKGIKSLNLELSWRPYSFEQTTPTLDELVGISNFQNYLATTYSDPGGDKSPRADLSNMSHLLTRPICIEDDNQRGVEVIKSATAELDSSAFDSTSIEGSDSNVLLTRAERHQYKSLGVPQTERGRGYAGRGDATRCDTHLHSSKNVVGSLSECVYCREGTSYDQPNSAVDTGLCYPSLPDSLSASSSKSGGVSVHHGRLSARPPSASPSRKSLSMTGLETKIPIPSLLHSSKCHQVDGDCFSSIKASQQSTVHDEQSLGGYLTIIAKDRLPGPSHETPLASPTFSEQPRVSPLPFDVEYLLSELTNLTNPVPPIQAPPLRDRRYLASVELLQNRSLMHSLQLDWLRLNLLERVWLNGADLVFDCNTALVFSPLCVLPSDTRSLRDRLCSLSWKYTRLAVVFRLYGDGVPGLQFPQTERGQEDLSARVIRSFKKLCRDLAIAEAFEEKQAQSDIQMYLARSDEQAAIVARTLGDIAESRSRWRPWDDRLLLGVDEQEVSLALLLPKNTGKEIRLQEESYLANIDGMNAFAAAAILSQISLHDFLALSPSERLQLATRIPIAEGMIEQFNESITQRREIFEIYVGSGDSDPDMQGA